MGFHKRYIDDDQIIEMYRTQGCQAVIDWYTKGADSLIMSGELVADISDILSLTLMTHDEKWNKISEIISDASIKKGFKK